MVDLRPLARRPTALYEGLQNPDALRLARRLRRMQARRNSVQVFATPRVQAEHQVYLERDLLVLREDANEALRALFADGS